MIADVSMLNVSPSLSSRRAWIEIKYTDDTAANAAVALLAEGVDRNRWAPSHGVWQRQSPSARRAWIEI